MKVKQLFAAALLFCSAGAWAQTDVTTTYLTNADFETSPTFDGTSLGSNTNPKSNATPTEGSELLSGAKNVYQISGWTLMTTETSDFARTFTLPYGTSLYINGNNTVANQQVTAPTNDSSVTENNNNVLFVEANWCNQALLGVKQVVNLPAGKYTLTFDTYVTTNLQYGTSRCGVSYADKSAYKWPTALNTWTNNEVTFTLSDATDVTISMGYLKNANQGGGNSPFLFVDNVKLKFTAVVIKDILQTAISAATKANTALGGTLNSAIATAQAVYDDNNATQDEVNAAAETLNNAVNQAMATASNIDVTDLFLTNANSSSTEGWTVNQSSSFRDQNKGLIGDYNVRFSAATVDDTHLATEYCFGFEARWSGNFASYNQTTEALPAGVYTLTYDVENVNGATSNLTYADYNYVQVGETKNYSATTEWMAAKSSWTTHTIRVTLKEAKPITVSFGYGTGSNNTPADNTPAIYVSHVKLSYSGFLAGAKAAWEEAKSAAEDAVADEAYENVTGSEFAALKAEIAKAEPTTAEGYDEAAAALNTATATFTGAKDAYDDLATLWSNGVPELIYATTEKYTAIGDAYFGEGDVVDAADASARTAAMKTAVRAYYESHALAEKVEDAVNCADAIAGADPDTNTGWTGGIGTDSRDWEKYTDAAGNLSGRYYDGGWSTSAGVNINMSRSIEIPAGKYLLTVTARGSESLTSYTLSVGEDAVDLPKNGSGEAQGVFGHGWDDVSLEFESDGNPVTLTIAAASTEYQQWISFNRFRLMRLELNNDVYAGTTEYNALNNAIATAEAKTLGFEDGQYAPYNNVAALEALAAAKAIDQAAELTNFKTDVVAATAALNDATWTANNGDVDAIYNGTFAETGTGSNPKGWSRSNNGWGQQITGLTAEANGVAEGTTTGWYYNNNGAWEYGKEGAYTMPLAENQTYKLSFKYSKHGNDWQNWMKASVVNNDEGLEVVEFAAAENGTNFVTAEAYFTTGAAGNYILSIEQNGNAHLTDVSLVKAESAALALNEGTTFEPINRTYYETVNVIRKVVAGYNTVCLPFDLSAEQVAYVFGENAKVYTFEEVESADPDDVTINFNTKEGNTIEANVPVLIGEATATTNETKVKTINGVMFKSGEPVVAGTNFDFVGTYAASTVIPAEDYFVGKGAIYKSAGATNIKAFRAYIHDKTENGSNVKFLVNGEEFNLPTAISEMNDNATENGTVYNLAGQRVNKAQKGLYIVNGKKVIIK